MTKYIFIVAFCMLMVWAPATEARTVYYEGAFPSKYSTNYDFNYGYHYNNGNNKYKYTNSNSYSAQREALIAQINYLLKLLQSNNYYFSSYTYQYPSNNTDRPDVETKRVGDVTEYSAELRGKVDMNRVRNGKVFFVYGQDEDQIEDIDSDYDEYDDVDEDGDDLQKLIADFDLDDSRTYEARVTGLEDNTDYYYSICVEYEDEDDDEVIQCGGVEDFETDRY